MSVTPRERAANELQELHLLFRYADYQDARAGRIDELLVRLEGRLRVMHWVGVAVGIAFAAWAALQFIIYGQTGEGSTLALAVLKMLLAGGYVTYWVYLSGHYAGQISKVRALLEVADKQPDTTQQAPQYAS